MFVQQSKMKYAELSGLQNVLYKWVVKNTKTETFMLVCLNFQNNMYYQTDRQTEPYS